AGLRTFDGLREMGQPGPWPTVTGMIYRYVARAYPGFDGGAIATLVVGGAFAAYLLRSALSVRDPASLLASSARANLGFVLFAAPVFFPWYVVLPVALIALVPEAPYLLVAVAITTLSRAVAPLVDLRPSYE